MKIRNDEFSNIKKNLDDNPHLYDIFEKKWIDKNIFNDEERENKHYLFWELLDLKKIGHLSKILLICKNENYFNSIISKLKKYRDKDNFIALLSELHVLYFYKTQENERLKVKDIEPEAIGKKGKKNDILLEIDNEDIYIEIFTLMDDKIDRTNRNLEGLIDNRLNKISNNPFIIGYNHNEVFSEDDIEDFGKFTEEIIEYAKNEKLEYYELDFKEDDLIKGELRLYPSKSGKGFVGSKMGNVRQINNDSRIKNIILNKIDFQLSEKTKNILVVNLMTMLSHFEDFDNAVLGSETVRVNLDKNESKTIRNNNGVIHDSKGRSRLVSSFIAFERGEYNGRKKIFITNANNPISEKYWDLL